MEKIGAYLRSSIVETHQASPYRTNQIIMELNDLLVGDPTISVWLNAQNDSSSPGRLHPVSVAYWLLERIDSVGIDQTLSELDQATRSEPIKPIKVMLFDGLSFEVSDDIAKHVFPNDISLSAIEQCSELNLSGVDEFPLTCLLLDEANDEDTFGLRCLDVCRCLSLARTSGYAVQPKHFLEAWPKHIPSPGGIRKGWGRRPRASLGPPLTDFDLRNTDRYLTQLSLLEQNNLELARTVLDHYSSAGSNVTIVEAAVHLRICLEAILMEAGGRGDSTFKVALRGALMLGGQMSEKLKNRDLLTKAYGAGSNAVHTAELKKKDIENWAPIQRVSRALIRQWLENGAAKYSTVDWQRVELGGSYPPSDYEC